MSVIIFSGSTTPLMVCADFFPGRDHDYQTLNLTFAVNVVKFGLIIGLFPKPLKPCVVSEFSICNPLSLLSALVLFHACYRAFLHKFNRK